MANRRINLCLAHMSETGMEQKYIKEAFDINWVVPLGPNVNGFEEDQEVFVSNREPITTNRYIKMLPAYVNGVSKTIFKVGMCLPAGPYVSNDVVRYIVETIKENIL